MAAAVISATGEKLMPTSNYRARKLLKSGRAAVCTRGPIFTIALPGRSSGSTQPVELKCDSGYRHVGVSIASETREYVNEQRDLLPDETKYHNNAREYRRTRRGRLRHRKPRFDNRRGLIAKEGFAPSIRHKRDAHIDLIAGYAKAIPITKVIVECGQFDTQVLKAAEAGLPVPEGEDYQHGEQYGYDTLREAVFARDGYKCIVCGHSALKGTILRIHHLGYRIGDRSNRMSNLGSVCTLCHTAKNHQPGGKLYSLKPKLNTFRGASFMTSVRYDMIRRLKELLPDIEIRTTYGAATKAARKAIGIKKTHANDAYCMGTFHPKHRTDFARFIKKRRNNRILERFYDAKYIDRRDHSEKSGSQLSCGRTNRSESRHGPKDERIYRCSKVSSGKRTIRRQRYAIRPGDEIIIRGIGKAIAASCKKKANGSIYVKLASGKETSLVSVTLLRHTGGWQRILQKGGGVSSPP